MLKHSLVYFAGVATIAAVTFAADGHAASIGFAAGILTAATAMFGVVSSRTRLRRAARFLAALADALDRSRPKAPEEPMSELERDVVSALRNWGARGKVARTAARQAIESQPAGATLQTVLPIAVAYAKKGLVSV